MQIGSSSPYPSFSPINASARPLSTDVSPDLARSDLAPATAPQAAPRYASTSSREQDGQAEGSSTSRDKTQQQLRQEQLEISELSQRDREVRAHEQAHAAVGGQHAGAPTYSFKRGPDGQRYAVSGEVGIDVSTVPNDPEATLQKMEIVRRAALAPAEPSAQDLSVAATAQAQAAQARVELAQMRAEEQAQGAGKDEAATDEEDQAATGSDPQQASAPPPNLDIYRRIGDLQEPVSRVDQVA